MIRRKTYLIFTFREKCREEAATVRSTLATWEGKYKEIGIIQLWFLEDISCFRTNFN